MEQIQSQITTRAEPHPALSVVCFGDSVTHGLVSANYVKMLQQRMGPQGFHFINAGVDGDHSVNLLRRIHHIIAKKPDYVIILVGTNDINADITPSLYWISRIVKGIFRKPSVEGYHDTIEEIVQKLKSNTSARIVLASPPLVGENLDSIANRRAREYGAALKNIAAREGTAYLPVHERQEETLKENGRSHGCEYTRSILRSIEMIFCHMILGESYESISKRRGYFLLTDGIHMNNRGAEIIAGEIEAYLKDSPHFSSWSSSPSADARLTDSERV